MKTNWSKPKTNILAGILDLRRALQAGQNARLIRARNEDCSHPIRVKIHDEDFRNYEFQVGYISSREEICNDSRKSDFEKYLVLNYKTCYGTQEAVNRYYETGLLSPDNFKGYGVSHLVNIKHMVMFLNLTDDKERAEMFRSQYLDESTGDERHFFDFYRYKHGSPWAIKKFRRKLWVVELLGDEKPSVPLLVKILNVIMYPLKYIPRRSVLKMPEYTNITYRIGGITNGFAVEFQIPKTFGFR